MPGVGEQGPVAEPKVVEVLSGDRRALRGYGEGQG